MATSFTHVFAAAAIVSLGPRSHHRVRLAVIGATLAALPDLDVASFRLGIEYAHPLGHRGFSHSLLFALLASLAATAVFFRHLEMGSRGWWITTTLLAACTASHGMLDAFTDAGLGVGFFIPFDTSRYFFPWRPLATSPLSISAFFSGPAFSILASEVLWVWLPLGACSALVRLLRAPLRGGAQHL